MTIWHFTLLLTSQQWVTEVVKNDNFTLLLTSSGQEWQFHIATDIVVNNFTLLTSSGRMAISHSY